VLKTVSLKKVLKAFVYYILFLKLVGCY